MIGQDFSGARRVVVLIEMPSGQQHGWEIGNPGLVKWEWAGLVNNSTHATITVRGEFYRMGRQGIAMPEQPELPPYQGEIEP